MQGVVARSIKHYHWAPRLTPAMIWPRGKSEPNVVMNHVASMLFLSRVGLYADTTFFHMKGKNNG